MRAWWFITGVGAGVYAVVKGRRAAEVFTPEGLHDRFVGLQRGWAVFSDEVRSGMDEKESQLREQLLAGTSRVRELPPGSSDPRPGQPQIEH